LLKTILRQTLLLLECRYTPFGKSLLLFEVMTILR
jgi:hypothetical protein